MTPSEHRARAMLMGAEWVANARCYKIRERKAGSVWYDDVTLEPVPYEVRYERRRIYHRMWCEMLGLAVQPMGRIANQP